MRLATVAVVTLFALPVRADEVIEDPTASKPVAVEPAPASSLPDFHVDAWHRTTVDTHWARDERAPALSEDVLRSWLRTTFSASGGTPSTLRYRLDVRLDVEARAKKGMTRDAWLYDAVPLAAYVDVPIGERVRVKVGEQIVTWGRMDLFSAADVLDRRDFRAGPAVDPTWSRLPTPTVRVDVHVCRCLDLTLAWSVISRPHRFEILGSSWAILGPGVLSSPSTVGARDVLGRVAGATDASTFMRVQDSFVQSTSATPKPFGNGGGGDLAARAVAHVGRADVGLTYGWVRAKVPVLTPHVALADVLTTGNASQVGGALSLLSALDAGEPLLVTEYPRYHQLALDFEGTIGAFTLGWELGFSPRRPLYVPDATGIPRRADSGLAQAGIRAQWLHGETFAATLEVDAMTATRAPPDGTRYLFLGARRTLLAALLGLRKQLGHHVLEGGALVTTSGPSVMVSARYGYELSDAWTVGTGAAWFPRVADAGGRMTPTLADVQVGRDYVEVFARYRR